MNSVSLVYELPLQKLLEAVGQTNKDTREDINSLLCNLPYISRRIAGLPSWKPDRIYLQYMIPFEEFVSASMYLGANGNLSCLAL